MYVIIVQKKGAKKKLKKGKEKTGRNSLIENTTKKGIDSEKWKSKKVKRVKVIMFLDICVELVKQTNRRLRRAAIAAGGGTP